MNKPKTKCCPVHGELPVTEFQKDKSKPDGFRSRCKRCAKAYNATPQRQAANAASRQKPRYKARQKAYDKSEAGRTSQRRYQRSVKGRATKAAYRKEHERENQLRRLYGISVETYDKLYIAQDGRCAICKRPFEECVERGRKHLHVDHDHTAGRVRGLLCGACNRAIGLLRDDAQLCLAAATYLQKAAVPLHSEADKS